MIADSLAKAYPARQKTSLENQRIMKTAAFIANIGLFVVMVCYLLTIENFQAEGLELLVLGLALAAPILSILALVKRIPGQI
jgi:hypothetical protein